MKQFAKSIEDLAQTLGKSRSQLILYGQRGAPSLWPMESPQPAFRPQIRPTVLDIWTRLRA